MSLDFKAVRNQVKEMGENAAERERRLQALREQARGLLESNANQQEAARQKVLRAARSFDPTLRCAVPTSEPLNQAFSASPQLRTATILAADGSQIEPSRHLPVDYCLINLGAIQMRTGAPEAPLTMVRTELMYAEQLYTETGTLTDAALALSRDLKERTLLAELAAEAQPPVVAFTDGPIELWGGKDADGTASFHDSLKAYLKSLGKLCHLNTAVAGYVDKPAANLVVRLLEVLQTPESELNGIRTIRPLRGVRDMDLFSALLQPGERSAVFEIQSKSAVLYQDELALHFFYLNVGREGNPWFARVEIPAWVAKDADMLDLLQATLIGQCRVLGSRPFPYLLHRAHEAAVVTREEQEQVTHMIIMELLRRGVAFGSASQKQALKDLPKKTRYAG